MLNIEEIRAALQDRVSSVVADRCGLSRNTVAAIKRGDAVNVKPATLRLLSYYLTGGGNDQ